MFKAVKKWLADVKTRRSRRITSQTDPMHINRKISHGVKKELITIAVLFALLIVISFIPVKGIFKLLIFLVPYFLAGFEIFKILFSQHKKKGIFKESLIITVTTVAAIISGAYFEAVTVFLLFRLGNVFINYVKSQMQNVGNAEGKKSDIEHFCTLFSKYFTPAFAGISLMVFIICLIATPSPWQKDLYRAIIITALSYPAAMTLSIPLAFRAFIGATAKKGITVKGTSYVYGLSKCATVVLNKTGTLTHGVFEITEIHPEKMGEEQFLNLLNLAFSNSENPYALAVRKAATKDAAKGIIKDVREIPEMGIVASLSGKILAVGSEALLEKLNVNVAKTAYTDATVLHACLGQTYLGHVVMSDSIREDADKALYRLRSAGVKYIVMLTEDKISDAARVADTLHAIDDFHHSLLPQDKVRIVEEILAESAEDETLAFVTNGAVDVAALGAADIGITLNGADLEKADVIINDDSLEKIPFAMKLADSVMLNVWLNIIVPPVVKLVLSVLGIIGIMSLSGAVFIDICVTLLAILNALRPLMKGGQ